jgi:hypothetical protein
MNARGNDNLFLWGSALLAFLHPFRQFDRLFMAPLMPGFAFLRSFPIRIG